MKKFIGMAAGLALVPYPEFAVLLFFLWLFWENLGDLTLRIYDDRRLDKTQKALKASMSANVEGYYVHMLTMRSKADRERRSRATLARKRRIKAIYRAIAPVSVGMRHLLQRGQSVPLRACRTF